MHWPGVFDGFSAARRWPPGNGSISAYYQNFPCFRSLEYSILQRRSLPNSYVMIHQPLSGTQGQATDLEIHAKHLMKLKRNLIDLYVKHTGKTHEVIGTFAQDS